MKFINLTENGKTIFVNPALITAYSDNRVERIRELEHTEGGR